MKKSLLVAIMLFAGMFTYCYGQDVNVNINNQGNSTNANGEFRINGISSSEDIGGVEIKGKIKYDKDSSADYDRYIKCLYAVLTNYNPFTVTVLFQDDYTNNSAYSVILRANETKEVFTMSLDRNRYLEPKPSQNTSYSIKGMIVRKLGK
ncbi:MAG: hypothetical protein IKI09_11065 [Bacteroidales bacterium]|nr:hypothetical protein [Bacteroidales bacterium]